MFTDIEGYTAMMQRDEEAAIRLRDRHRGVLETEHGKFHGTVVQYYGDGTLSIFPSAVQAVECAITMQQAFNESPEVPVRMGLHIGDIMIKDGSVFGDGVNLASRIESLGVAGCVLISDKVNDELRNHPSLKTRSVGTFQFKNIERQVEVFALDHIALVKPERHSLNGKTSEKKTQNSPETGSPKSIAVLPFVNMSNDPEQEYFSDGIAEEILNSLSHLTDLKVAGRTSSFQFKGKNFDLRELGRILGVNTVLEGSVRKQRNHLRITVQLVNVADGFHMWGEKYDCELDDIFVIQDEVALSVTLNLKIRLLEGEKANITRQPTVSKEAYDLYLKGRFYWNRRGSSLRQALEYFLQAVALDPEFSLAHAALADTYALFGFYSLMPPHEVIPKARLAAEEAIRLNAGRVAPYSVLAYIATFYDWNWHDAKQQFEKAISINPDYAASHYWYANYLCWSEMDYAHAIKEAQTAVELEPLNSHAHNTLASAYVCSGRYEEACHASQTAVELDANSFLSHCGLCMALHGLGKLEDALDAIRNAVRVSGRHQYALLMSAWLHAVGGEVLVAGSILDELMLRSETEYISGLSVAVAAYYSGDQHLAFRSMDRAFEERASLLTAISGYPFLEFIRTEARFRPFLERMAYPAPVGCRIS
jgi:TolB-like protein/Tfp pilus assembly protein PilF